MAKAFYDPFKTYIKNYDEGPFGGFINNKHYKDATEPKFSFLGQKVNLPFGIPAGPLLNSNFIKGAFEQGYDLCVYKTVRTSIFPSHPFPNLLAIHKEKITLKDIGTSVTVDKNFTAPLSITNSFGVPSKDPAVWQEDVKKAISYEKKGKVCILSFMGTLRSHQSNDQLIEDYIIAAKLAKETGAKILETNLSCPNCTGLVCYTLPMVKIILPKMRKVIGNTPLIVKIGYFANDLELEKLAEVINESADAISGINTLQANIVNKSGNQALPGRKRLKSGVCGFGIKWAGLETIKKLNGIRLKKNYKYKLIGVGGVMNAADYQEYLNVGADAIMSATGAMWNPNLAKEIKSYKFS